MSPKPQSKRSVRDSSVVSFTDEEKHRLNTCAMAPIYREHYQQLLGQDKELGPQMTGEAHVVGRWPQ